MWITPDRVLYVGLIGAPSMRTMGSVNIYVAQQGAIRVRVVPADRRRGRGVRGRLRGTPAGAAEGTDRVRQDPVRRAHGVAARARAGDGGVPRGPHAPPTSSGATCCRATRRCGWTGRSPGRCAAAPSATSTRSSRRARTRRSSSTPLTDHRRILPIEKTGELLAAHPDFLLVISYNPGYQSVLKDLKPSTRQRFVSLEFDYPEAGRRGDDHRPRERRRPRRSPSAWPQIGRRCRHLREHGLRGGRQHAVAHLRRPARSSAASRPAGRATSPSRRRSATTSRCSRRCADIVDVLLP